MVVGTTVCPSGPSWVASAAAVQCVCIHATMDSRERERERARARERERETETETERDQGIETRWLRLHVNEPETMSLSSRLR